MDLLDRDRVPLKQVPLKVTGTNWTTDFAFGVAYQLFDGQWRFVFNLKGVLSVPAITLALNVQGVGFLQSSSIAANSTDNALKNLNKCTCGENGSSNLNLNADTTVSFWIVSGDVALAGPPAWIGLG